MLLKRNILTAIFLFLIAGFLLSGQTWYQVSMRPDETSVVLRVFDGYSSYPWISPLLLVALASFSLAALMKAKARGVVFAVGSFFSALLFVLSTSAVVSKDLRNVQNQLEQATGIAASHGQDAYELAVEPEAQVSLVIFALLAVTFLLASFAQAKWSVKKPSSPRKRTEALATDSISLWDEQR